MMRPATPTLKVVGLGAPITSVGPSSPPQTPTAATPAGFLGCPPPAAVPPPHNPHLVMASAPTILPVRNGPEFSFTTAAAIRPEQLSPRSCTTTNDSSAVESDTDSGHDGGVSPSNAASPSRSEASERAHHPGPPPTVQPRSAPGRGSMSQGGFVVEELSDFAESDDDRDHAIRPHAIEYAESDQSPSRAARPTREIDHAVMYHLNNLNCSDNESDETDVDELEFQQFLLRRREHKRRTRMTTGSIGKRNFSESIGSDTDREDLRAAILGQDAAAGGGVGSSARRLRRKIGSRHSVQLQDHHPQQQPPPRIDEVEEPGSSGDDMVLGDVSEALARELPYYEYVSTMEIDSP